MSEDINQDEGGMEQPVNAGQFEMGWGSRE